MEKVQILDKTFRLYMPEAEIQLLVKDLAARISADYQHRNPILCPVLTGSYMFASDLSRNLTIPAPISFVRYFSYEGLSSTGEVKRALPFSEKCRGRDIIIVEDIIDSGLSMKTLLQDVHALEPASVAICSFLFKPGNFKGDYKVDYYGKAIPNDFIVGYGMDYDELGRNLPDIYILDMI